MRTFSFIYTGERVALTLSHSVPYIQPDSRQRMFQALANGCPCKHDGDRTASLTQRNGAAWLQCDACGSALGGAMGRAQHPSYPTYIPWRSDLVESYKQAEKEWQKLQPTWEEIRDKKQQERDAEYRALVAEREAAYRLSSLEYERWCRSSPEWAEIKKRIFWRSRGHCESCLAGNAEVVHHLTYSFGKLPPAWHLKAVCVECHERLHTAGDDWCDYGMARG